MKYISGVHRNLFTAQRSSTKLIVAENLTKGFQYPVDKLTIGVDYIIYTPD